MKKNEFLRLLYIEAHLLVNAVIGRPTLIAKFTISKETATRSLAFYEESCPGQMVIDMGLKRPAYVATESCKPCLFGSIKDAKEYIDINNKIDDISDHLIQKL